MAIPIPADFKFAIKIFTKILKIVVHKQVLCLTPLQMKKDRDIIITSPPRHSVGGRLVTVTGVCRCLSSSVTLHGWPAGGFTRSVDSEKTFDSMSHDKLWVTIMDMIDFT